MCRVAGDCGWKTDRSAATLFVALASSRRFRRGHSYPALSRLIKPDAPHQVRKTGVAAQGIKVRMHFDMGQNA
jgi:hypothetical protein